MRPMGKINQAAAFLRDILSDGPRPTKDVQHLASEAGIPWDTVKKAKKRANIIATTARRENKTIASWHWAIAGNPETAFLAK